MFSVFRIRREWWIGSFHQRTPEWYMPVKHGNDVAELSIPGLVIPIFDNRKHCLITITASTSSRGVRCPVGRHCNGPSPLTFMLWSIVGFMVVYCCKALSSKCDFNGVETSHSSAIDYADKFERAAGVAL